MKIYDTRQAAKALNTTIVAIRHAINRGKDDLQEYAEYRKKNGYDYEE